MGDELIVNRTFMRSSILKYTFWGRWAYLADIPNGTLYFLFVPIYVACVVSFLANKMNLWFHINSLFMSAHINFAASVDAVYVV